jgi:acyl-ACP thioesterase
MARYLQDVATDDALDAGLAEGWVLRRTELRIHAFPRFRDQVDLVTWCSGIAASAAERCTTIEVDGCLAVEAVAVWAFVGPDGRPARIDGAWFAAFGVDPGRRVSTRLRHPDPLPEAVTRPWPLRAADVDVARHVNNAVAFVALEDVLVDAGRAGAPPPWSVEVEYRAAIDPDASPVLAWSREADGTITAGLVCDGRVHTTARLGLPGEGPASP